jgi:hypothetical protein
VKDAAFLVSKGTRTSVSDLSLISGAAQTTIEGQVNEYTIAIIYIPTISPLPSRKPRQNLVIVLAQKPTRTYQYRQQNKPKYRQMVSNAPRHAKSQQVTHPSHIHTVISRRPNNASAPPPPYSTSHPPPPQPDLLSNPPYSISSSHTSPPASRSQTVLSPPPPSLHCH